MAFWGGKRLETEGKDKGIIDDFDEGQIDCSAYTLTMGSEAYVTPGHGENLRENDKIRLKAAKKKVCGRKTERYGGGSLKIPAGQFAFLLTEEAVSIPDDAMGFISLKSGIKFQGLVNVSGFHVDPGFKGRLIYAVFNAGPSQITICRGDDLFLLWIADLSGGLDDQYTKGDDEQLEIKSALITQVTRENHSLQALSTKIDKIDEQFRILRNVSAGIAAALALLLTLWGLKQVVFDDPPQPNPSDSQTIVIEPAPPVELPPEETTTDNSNPAIPPDS